MAVCSNPEERRKVAQAIAKKLDDDKLLDEEVSMIRELRYSPVHPSDQNSLDYKVQKLIQLHGRGAVADAVLNT